MNETLLNSALGLLEELADELIEHLAVSVLVAVADLAEREVDAWLEEHLDVLVEAWSQEHLPPVAQHLVKVLLCAFRQWFLSRVRQAAETYAASW